MAQHIDLQSEHLAVRIVPQEGGRISSLRCLRTGVEFLLQTTRQHPYPTPSREASFSQGAVAGIEECLPTVARCQLNAETVPDHGDFWQLPWDVLDHSPQHITLAATGFSQPLRFEKKLRLHHAGLHIEARITNIGTTPASFLYATHPLLAVEPGDRILLPPECRDLTLYDSHRQRLGRMGDLIPWPNAALDRITEPTAQTAEMLYTGRLQQGWCGLYRATQQQGIVLRFDTQQLPCLGLWICCGGWPDDTTSPRQYAFAPEPTTAPCGSLQQAAQRNLAIVLQPRETFPFTQQFILSDPAISLDHFASSLTATAPSAETQSSRLHPSSHP